MSDLLAQLQRDHNNTLEHEHVALTEIHHLTGHDQLFDTIFLYESYPIDTSAFMGVHELTITDFTSREYNHYPLSVMALPGQELGLRVEFDTAAFTTADIEVLVERFERVLGAMTADPGQRLSSLDVLDDGERARLDGWANRAVLSRPGPAPVSIPEVFAAQVTRAPHAEAVTFEGQTLSYGELDEAANRLANLLAVHGAGPGEYVGLLLPRSADAIVAMLAVLKCGAAYVPMDPAVPAARLDFMLADAAPIAVITTAELRSRLDGRDLLVVEVDDEAASLYPSTALVAPAADDIAYLIYTSGTTGVPKGVAITHRNLTQVLESVAGGVAVGSGCGVVAVAFTGFRCVGVGDLRGAAARRAVGDRAGVGGRAPR